MITIIDYESGNLRSVQKAFEFIGTKARITQNPKDILSAEKIVLPGVGAMQQAIEKLEALSLIDPIKKMITDGKPFLGICVGFQLLFEKSTEGGGSKGLGILPGEVTRFENNLKVPQMGWNQLQFQQQSCPLLKNIEDNSNVYFCHSYFATPEDKSCILTTTDYGEAYTSAVWKDNVFGVQFHPEKSQNIGLTLLTNFVEI